MNRNRQQVLLKEYEICQQDNSSIGNQIWLSASVLMSANVALLAWFAYVIIKELPLLENTEGFVKVLGLVMVLGLVILLGLAIIAIFYCWKRWLNRMGFLKFINYERMREIETALGMRKNWRAYGLDNFDKPEKLTSEEKELLVCEIADEWGKLRIPMAHDLNELVRWKRERVHYAPSKGLEGSKCMAIITMVLWGIFVVAAWVLMRVVAAWVLIPIVAPWVKLIPICLN